MYNHQSQPASHTAAQIILQRCEILASLSEEPDCLTRGSFTPAMRRANGCVETWMRGAGMVVWQDTLGNLIGRYAAAGEAGPRPVKTLLFGSHLDTVRNAGKYDGPLGILVALAAVETLHRQAQRLPFAIEIIAFADEEGLRFQTSYLASRVVAGSFQSDYLALEDDQGTSLAEAIWAFGGNPTRLERSRKDPDELLGYCEVHIEQGPVLEARQLPVGVVTAIAGQSRIRLAFTGRAGHAGTVPMELRTDALCGAAEFILAVESLAYQQHDLVATVGHLAPEPDVSNVIAGRVRLSLDVRHCEDEHRYQACNDLEKQAQALCERRGLTLEWQLIDDNQATHCAPRLRQLMANAVGTAGYPVHQLPSGAGHDTVAMADLAESTMLFVRCRDGVSHHPDEAVDLSDVAVAVDVIGHFLELVAAEL